MVSILHINTWTENSYKAWIKKQCRGCCKSTANVKVKNTASMTKTKKKCCFSLKD